MPVPMRFLAAAAALLGLAAAAAPSRADVLFRYDMTSAADPQGDFFAGGELTVSDAAFASGLHIFQSDDHGGVFTGAGVTGIDFYVHQGRSNLEAVYNKSHNDF